SRRRHTRCLSDWSSDVCSSDLACHVRGSFVAKKNISPLVSTRQKLAGPPQEFIYDRLAHPPATFRQEKLKSEVRLPAPRRFIAEHRLNEVFSGEESALGIIVQGGLYNGVILALKTLGLADAFGANRLPILALNVTYPLLPEEITQFCAGKRAVLVVEEGFPAYLEQAINALLRKADLNTAIVGKSVLPEVGEYTAETLLTGLARFVEGAVPP